MKPKDYQPNIKHVVGNDSNALINKLTMDVEERLQLLTT